MNINEKLQTELATMIAHVNDGVSFLAAELPDVISQLLMWKLVESAVMTALGLVSATLIAVFFIKNSGKGAVIHEDGGGRYAKHELTLTHDGYGEIAPWLPVTAVVSFAAACVAISLTSLAWLQILIAPKVYLIEYAAKLAGA